MVNCRYCKYYTEKKCEYTNDPMSSLHVVHGSCDHYIKREEINFEFIKI